jgi:hypothetical protein
LSAGEEEELEEQEAQYHHHSARLLKLLKSSSISKPAVSSAPSKSPQVFPVAASGSNSSLSPLQVRQVGEDMREFHCFLVRVQKDQRIHETLPFKTLKELKYGATTPFTLGIIETLVNEPLPPSC